MATQKIREETFSLEVHIKESLPINGQCTSIYLPLKGS